MSRNSYDETDDRDPYKEDAEKAVIANLERVDYYLARLGGARKLILRATEILTGSPFINGPLSTYALKSNMLKWLSWGGDEEATIRLCRELGRSGWVNSDRVLEWLGFAESEIPLLLDWKDTKGQSIRQLCRALLEGAWKEDCHDHAPEAADGLHTIAITSENRPPIDGISSAIDNSACRCPACDLLSGIEGVITSTVRSCPYCGTMLEVKREGPFVLATTIKS